MLASPLHWLQLLMSLLKSSIRARIVPVDSYVVLLLLIDDVSSLKNPFPGYWYGESGIYDKINPALVESVRSCGG